MKAYTLQSFANMGNTEIVTTRNIRGPFYDKGLPLGPMSANLGNVPIEYGPDGLGPLNECGNEIETASVIDQKIVKCLPNDDEFVLVRFIIGLGQFGRIYQNSGSYKDGTPLKSVHSTIQYVHWPEGASSYREGESIYEGVAILKVGEVATIKIISPESIESGETITICFWDGKLLATSNIVWN